MPRVTITVTADLLPPLGQEVEDTVDELVALMESVVVDYGHVADIRVDAGTATVAPVETESSDDRFPVKKGSFF